MSTQARDSAYARILRDAIRAADAVDTIIAINRASDRLAQAPSIGDLVTSEPVYRAHMAVVSAPEIRG